VRPWLALPRIQFSLRTALLIAISLGVLVCLFSWLEPVYYRAKWRSFGKGAFYDAELLERLLAMGPVGWKIATDDTISTDPETRKRCWLCLQTSQGGINDASAFFWRIWARRCLQDRKFLLQFLDHHVDAIPVIIMTVDKCAFPDTHLVYARYQKEFLDVLARPMSPLNPPDLIQGAVGVVESAGDCLAAEQTSDRTE
jgi:hypothetical protein